MAAPAPTPEIESGAESEVWDREHRSLTIGLILTVSFSAFEALAVATALPVIVEEIGGLSLYGWAFSGFMLANLVGVTAGGSLADRRSPVVPFAAGAVLFIIGLLIAGVASGMTMLILARLVQGLGAGALASVSYVAVGRAYSPPARPRMIALLSSAWVVPGLIGPALAGIIAEHLGWRWVFLGLAPPTVVGAALAIRALRRLEPAADATEPDRTALAVLLSVGAGLLLLGLQGGSLLWVIPLCLAGGAIAFYAFERLLPEGTLRARPGLPAAVALIGLIGFAFFAAEAFLPLCLTEVRGQSPTLVGLPLTFATVTWTAGAWIQAREAERRSRRVLMVVGLVGLCLGILLTAAVLLPAVPLLTVALGWGIAGLGMGIAYSTIALVILECAPPGREGYASAALQLSITLGTALGTGLGGALVAGADALGWGIATGIGLADLMTLVALALALACVARIPRRRVETEAVPTSPTFV